MSLSSQQLFDGLALIGRSKLQTAGIPVSQFFLHQFVGREPTEAAKDSPIHDLKQLTELFAKWPYFAYVHPSHILPHLHLCPEASLGYLIYSLPQPLQQAAAKHVGCSPVALPNSRVASLWIVRSWSAFFDALETTLQAFSTPSQTTALITMDELEIRRRCLGMALYALEPRLKHFIDRDLREAMKTSLRSLKELQAIDFIRFIRASCHELPTLLPYSFPMELWKKDSSSLQEICQRFGLACLGRLLSVESVSVKQELRLHVTAEFWSTIPIINSHVKPEVITCLRQSFDLVEKFQGDAPSAGT